MALTRSFKETVQARILREPEFGAELFAGAIECFLEGDIETGKSVLRDYINATVGFTKLGELSGISEKSLMRMFSAAGNPQTSNLFKVISCIQEHVGFQVRVGTDYPEQPQTELSNGQVLLFDRECPWVVMPFDCQMAVGSNLASEVGEWLDANPWGQPVEVELPRDRLGDICGLIAESVGDDKLLEHFRSASSEFFEQSQHEGETWRPAVTLLNYRPQNAPSDSAP